MKPLLEVSNLSQHPLFAALSFKMHPGEIWGLLGRNGSGKTTLLHTLAGLIRPTQGAVFLEGNNLLSYASKTIAQQIGLLFQETTTSFAQTVYEYCFRGRYPYSHFFSRESQNDEKIVQDALSAMDLSAFAAQPIHTLSGGEKRRLNIATLIAQAPTLYLLDEPMNHLDWQYQSKILTYLTHLQNNAKSIFMSLHDLNMAADFCDYLVLLLPEGQCLVGKTADILTVDNVSAAYQHPFTYQNSLWQPAWKRNTSCKKK